MPSRTRRIGVAAAFAAALLIGAPVAYAAGSATKDGDEVVSSSESAEGTGLLGGSRGGGHDHSSGGSSSGQDDGSDEENGADGAGGSGDPDGGNADGGDDAGAEGSGRDDAEREESEDGNRADSDGGNEQGGGDDVQGLDILASDCSNSSLIPHNGFQESPRCVDTSFGEVAAVDKSPSLLITEAPTEVAPGEDFSITVSTRNLVRDRFLPAAQGGYYVEASLLNGEGLQRGHFHTACRVLPNPGEAPDSSPAPAFFEATEDGGGGAAPDEVTINVPGVDEAGQLQCSSWAGDGSHRIPMMERANQTPAFDSIRVQVG
ncbi:hypothetical protein WIS52_11540 [Pseudonocardia nematodicida]|uniref:Pecanex-like protein 1 n=1 Tax=Pseudonocardia nematodicida TaxID=1206997 RepID=A0ABV1K9F7_9PSEU